jgi:hypothetical protein
MRGYRIVQGVFVALTATREACRVKPKGWTWTPDGRCAMPGGRVVRSAKAARRIALGGECRIEWRRDE